MSDTRDVEEPPQARPIEIRRDGLELRVRPTAHYAEFWKRVAADTWEPQTFRVLREHLSPSETLLDIGAWIGPTALYGAHFAGRVIALEPDPVATEELRGNLALNPAVDVRVEVIPASLATSDTSVTLFCGGFHHNAESTLGDSMTSLLPSSSASSQQEVEVEGICIETLEARCDMGRLGLVKMDIEGGEYVVLPSMGEFFRRHQSPLYISFHIPPLAQRDERIGETFQFLCDTFKAIRTAKGKPLPLREVLAMNPDWSALGPDTPGGMLMTVAREGLVATFD